ncbi:MAG TPA: hypothetical protein VK597_05405 [Inquilinus sp.]|nr:hypothetical protein [Inquilinus sp.]
MLAHDAEHFVSGGMAALVVHRLELIKIDQQQREARPRGTGRFHRCIQLLAKQDAVGQAGQRIVMREIVGARFGIAEPGHVRDHADQERDQIAVGTAQMDKPFAGDHDPDDSRPVGDHLLVLMRLAGGEHLVVDGPEDRGLLRWLEIEIRPADQRGAVAPQHVAEGLVDDDETVVPILDEDRIGNGVQDLLQRLGRIHHAQHRRFAPACGGPFNVLVPGWRSTSTGARRRNPQVQSILSFK